MSKPVTDFNIADGLMGIGKDLMIDLITQMTSFRDVQNFLGICKKTKDLINHERFPNAIKTAAKDETGTKALILRRLPRVNTVVDENITEEDKDNLETVLFDVTKKEDIINADAKRIRSLAVQYKSIRIDSNSSFFGHAMIYVDGLGQLRKELVDFDDLDDIPEKRPLVQKWMDSIELPPTNIKFVRVRSSGNFTMALAEDGSLWTRGWNEDGTWTESERFSLLNRFKSENGALTTEAGPAHVIDFSFEVIHVNIIFDNGAVWSFGSIQEFANYKTQDYDIKSEGFVELTSKKLKPVFEKTITDEVAPATPQYGIFGDHKVVKYFRKIYAFLTEDGIPIIRYVVNNNTENKFYYTPIDLKYFGGEKIVQMNHYIDDVYITETGKCYFVKRDRYDDLLKEIFTTPRVKLELGFEIGALKRAFLCRHESVALLHIDGTLYKKDITHPEKKPEETLTNVSAFAEELSQDEKNQNGMIIKYYTQASLSCYFLFE